MPANWLHIHTLKTATRSCAVDCVEAGSNTRSPSLGLRSLSFRETRANVTYLPLFVLLAVGPDGEVLSTWLDVCADDVASYEDTSEPRQGRPCLPTRHIATWGFARSELPPE